MKFIKTIRLLIKTVFAKCRKRNDISMRQFREINEVLHPMGGLQERIWNSLQIMNDFGKNVFCPPPIHHFITLLIILL